jgi:hypothetical protein
MSKLLQLRWINSRRAAAGIRPLASSAPIDIGKAKRLEETSRFFLAPRMVMRSSQPLETLRYARPRGGGERWLSSVVRPGTRIHQGHDIVDVAGRRVGDVTLQVGPSRKTAYIASVQLRRRFQRPGAQRLNPADALRMSRAWLKEHPSVERVSFQPQLWTVSQCRLHEMCIGIQYKQTHGWTEKVR